jgi:hypothetical protein
MSLDGTYLTSVLRRMSALRHKQSYRGLARIYSRGWQRNYAPNRRILGLCSSIQIRFGETCYDTATAYLAGPAGD